MTRFRPGGRRLPFAANASFIPLNQWPLVYVCTSLGFSARRLNFSVAPKTMGYLVFNGTRVPYNPLAVARSFGSLAVAYTPFSFILCYREREPRG